jgi:hypothetical protein
MFIGKSLSMIEFYSIKHWLLQIRFPKAVTRRYLFENQHPKNIFYLYIISGANALGNELLKCYAASEIKLQFHLKE